MAYDDFSLSCVATLVAGPEGALTDALVAACRTAFAERGGREVGPVQIYAPGLAADIVWEGLSSEALYEAAHAVLGAAPVDVIVQYESTRRKTFLLADMESTIIQEEILDEMADRLGFRAKVADITHRGMNGEIDFATSLRERVALFAGQPVSLLEDMATRMTISPGAAELVTAMKAAGGTCWLATGGFTYFADIIAQKLGFDRVLANVWEIRDGRLGRPLEPILGKDGKKKALDEGCATLGIPLSATLTMGDGANDVPMLEAANQGGGLGVAYRAKPSVRALVAPQLNHADFCALVWAQGLSVRG